MIVQHIPIEKIKPNPNRVRKEMGNKVYSLENLARSIKKEGLMHPILVKELDDGDYLIIKGERRYEACIYVKAKTIDCVITKTEKNPQMIALISTLSRKDLTEVEKAEALFMIRTKCEFKGNVSLARSLGISESYIRKLLAIYNLPEDIKESINSKKIKVQTALENSKKKLKSNDKKRLTEISISVSTLKHLNLTSKQLATLFRGIKDTEQTDELKKILSE